MAKSKKSKGPKSAVLIMSKGSAAELVAGVVYDLCIYGSGKTEEAALKSANANGDLYDGDPVEVAAVTITVVRTGSVVSSLSIK